MISARILELSFVLIARSLSVLGGMVMSVAIARFFGAEALGKFAVFASLVGVAAIIARRGIDLVVTREVANAEISANSRVGLLIFWAGLRKTFWVTTIVAAITSALIFSRYFGIQSFSIALIFLFFFPIFIMLSVYSAYLRGKHRSGAAALLDLGSLSGLAALVLVPALYVLRDQSETLIYASLLVASALVAIGIFPHMRIHETDIESDFKLDHVGSLFFLASALSVFVLQTGAFAVVAPVLDAGLLGQIRAVERLSLLITFPMVAITAYVAPLSVRAHRTGQKAEMRKLFYQTTVASMVLSTFPMLLLVFFPKQMLLIFGSEFVDSQNILLPMVIGNFVFSVFGASTMICFMSGLARSIAWMSIILLVVAIPAYIIAATYFGAMGFVYVYMITLLVRSAWILTNMFRLI